MKLVCGFLTLLLVAVALSAQTSADEKVISDLEYRWAEAQRTGNADVVSPMLADTFTNTDADGESYDKSRLLSNLKGGKWDVKQHQRCGSESLRKHRRYDRILDG
jgi:hypothetical protein